MHWRTSRRTILLDRRMVMGILNVTPDSFSDGGQFLFEDDALRRVDAMVAGGADMIDVGGESTRPGSSPVDAAEEIARTIPVIEAAAKRFDLPISIDTTKSEVARAAIDAGAEIVNDISGLRFDETIAAVAAAAGAGLILMHSRGQFETMHSEPPVEDIMSDVTTNLRRSIGLARSHGVADEQIAIDIGIGFGKTLEQNLELLAKLDKITSDFDGYPVVVGTSRKSFIGRILGDARPSERLGGSLATALLAINRGAHIVRVHDVKETVGALRMAQAIKRMG